MTTTDAAAARRHSMAVALSVAISLGLAGCGGGSFSLFSALTNNPAKEEPAELAAAQVPQAPVARVAINSIVGPPDALGRQLHQEFVSSLERQRVGVAQGKDNSADFNLRPYILASKERHGTKVSYVLDVTEPSGKRVNRFSGEEIVAASPSQDPWGAITPAVAEALAAKATGAFVAWLPNARSSAAIADASPAAATRPGARPAARRTASIATASTATTGSISRDDRQTLAVVVPSVTGAPGDGRNSLTAAIQRELKAKGIALTDRPTGGTYVVEGNVTLGAARDGKQPIQIEWVVRNPDGKKRGTVSQKNDIPAGSLDGAWGGIADQAARAAVQGIAKLLPNGGRA
ncbi:MAG TPA: hypothetical protein VFZ16_06370 [Hyphomicrobiaceae bacterium]|nr:hypothetical protein [Hyphomicrobiaceae bacterium]